MFTPIKFIPLLTGMYMELLDFDYIGISDKGELKNFKNKKMLKQSTDIFGYKKVKIGNKYYAVHRLVALMFIEREDEDLKLVCHKNRVREDNRSSNLMWANNNIISSRRSSFKRTNIDRPIVGFKDGKVIGAYYNGNHAEKVLKVNRSEVYRCCKKERKSTGGYNFMYGSEYLKEFLKWDI